MSVWRHGLRRCRTSWSSGSPSSRASGCSTWRRAQVRWHAAIARLGADVSAIDIADPMLEKARASAAEEGLTVAFELGDVEYLPYDDAGFDVLVSNFGVVFAPDHANVASELARVTRPGGRLGFTAWKPNSKLGEMYRRFTEEPIEGREAYEWGREDHVEDMLGDDFELEFEDGTLWLEAESGEEIWRLFSESAPPVIALLRRLDPAPAGGVPRGVRGALRGLPHRRWRRPRAAPLPARPRPAQMSEVARLLQELIRLDTTNPPGNETLAAEVLRDYLEAAGVECALYARVPERANLVARIRGRGDGPSLALLSHTDVVLADAREWEREPFGGELVDDEVWGRGALDMKGEVAASAVALATLAREGWRGSGDLIFVAAADEEVGDGFGLQWLVEAHPDAVRADFSVNEGAGDRVELGGKVLYLCSTAEKMSSPFRAARARTQRPRVDADRSPTTRS